MSVETEATPVVETPAPEAVNVDSAFSQAYQSAESATPTQATPVVEAAPVAAAPPSELFEEARSLGINIGEAKSEADVARALISQYKSVQPYATFGQQVAPHHEKFQEWLQSQQQPKEETPKEPEWSAESYFKDQWKVPQLTPQIEHAIKHGLVHQNENGAWEPAAGYELMASPIVNELNQYHIAKQEHVQSLFGGNPYEKFHNVLLEPMRRAWQEDVRKILAEQNQERQQVDAVSQYEQANAAWLFADVNGQKAFTAEGQKMAEAMHSVRADLVAQGVANPDPAFVLKLAEAIARPTKGAAAATQAAPAASAAVPTPIDPATVSNQQKASFLENALDRARHSPNSGGFTQADDSHPVNLEQGELDQLFVTAARAKKAQAA